MRIALANRTLTKIQKSIVSGRHRPKEFATTGVKLKTRPTKLSGLARRCILGIFFQNFGTILEIFLEQIDI